jgi:hypothetical protein
MRKTIIAAAAAAIALAPLLITTPAAHAGQACDAARASGPLWLITKICSIDSDPCPQGLSVHNDGACYDPVTGCRQGQQLGFEGCH